MLGPVEVAAALADKLARALETDGVVEGSGVVWREKSVQNFSGLLDIFVYAAGGGPFHYFWSCS